MTLIIEGLLLTALAGFLIWFVCDRLWHGLAIAVLAAVLLPLVAETPAGDVSRLLSADAFAAGSDGKDQIVVASATATILVSVIAAACLFGATKAAARIMAHR